MNENARKVVNELLDCFEAMTELAVEQKAGGTDWLSRMDGVQARFKAAQSAVYALVGRVEPAPPVVGKSPFAPQPI